MNEKENRAYDLSMVREASDDLAYLKEITGYFIDSAGEMLHALEAALNTSDWENAQNISHKLKSSFYLFGLNEGGNALSSIELNLRDKVNDHELPDLFLVAREQGEKAITQLKRDFHQQN